jgi:hypothetical protein
MISLQFRTIAKTGTTSFITISGVNLKYIFRQAELLAKDIRNIEIKEFKDAILETEIAAVRFQFPQK